MYSQALFLISYINELSMLLKSKIKISVNTDISIIEFNRYIDKILVDIFTKISAPLNLYIYIYIKITSTKIIYIYIKITSTKIICLIE